MKELIKKAVKATLGDYAIYHVYSLLATKERVPAPINADVCFVAVELTQVEESAEELMREQKAYHGQETFAFACTDNNQIVGLCYFWHGNRYKKRNFWPLSEGEAKLVQIVIAPQMRGRGLAPQLIEFSTNAMFEAGFKTLYARIWHSNLPSIRSFERARWKQAATVVEVNPLRRKRPWRFEFKTFQKVQGNK